MWWLPDAHFRRPSLDRPDCDGAGVAASSAANLDLTLYDRDMRVEVNSDLCQGHNRCYALAPELFDVDDYGTAIVIGDGSVAPELEDKARLAVANCPEYAITISE
jgi:ferredoxin